MSNQKSLYKSLYEQGLIRDPAFDALQQTS